MTADADAVIVGGGPAGAACAARLAAAGLRVILLERDRIPQPRVCGEFLTPEAVRFLAGLGIDAAALGGVAVERVRLAAGARAAEARLPLPAVSLSRATLDAALLERARRHGVDVRLGARTVSLEEQNGVWRARLADGETVTACAAFLATGKHDLRGWRRPRDTGDGLVGFKQHWRLSPGATAALAGTVELILFDGGYAGLQLVEGGRANLCLLTWRRRLAREGATWAELVAALRAESPWLARRLDGAVPCRQREAAVAVHRPGIFPLATAGPWRLGDQAAVAPPFTGTGIAVALYSAHLAANMFLAGAPARDFQRRLVAELGRAARRGAVISCLLDGSRRQGIAVQLATLVPATLRWAAAATRITGQCPADAAGRATMSMQEPARIPRR